MRPVTAPDRPSIQLPHLPSGGMAVSARNHPTEPLPHTVRQNRSSQSARGGSRSPPRANGAIFSRGNASSFARVQRMQSVPRPTYAKPVRYSLTGIPRPLFPNEDGGMTRPRSSTIPTERSPTPAEAVAAVHRMYAVPDAPPDAFEIPAVANFGLPPGREVLRSSSPPRSAGYDYGGGHSGGLMGYTAPVSNLYSTTLSGYGGGSGGGGGGGGGGGAAAPFAARRTTRAATRQGGLVTTYHHHKPHPPPHGPPPSYHHGGLQRPHTHEGARAYHYNRTPAGRRLWWWWAVRRRVVRRVRV